MAIMDNHAQSHDILVSMFANATSPEARCCKLSAVLDAIKNGTYAKSIAKLREIRKTDPDTYNLKKKLLPAFTVSGTAKNRKEPLVHSGLIQGDIDHLNGHNDIVLEYLKNDPHVAFVFVSPSGDGIKFGIVIDPKDHLAGFIAAQEYFRSTYKLEIDPSVKDRLRLCFVSHDPDLWIRPDAIPVPPVKQKPVAPPPARSTPLSGSRQRIAEQVLGPVTWDSADYGFCACPGAHLHTTPTNPKDCDVRLPGAPTIHCFHGSCQNIVDGVNWKLRSLIGKSEYVASPNKNGVVTNEPDSEPPPEWVDRYFGEQAPPPAPLPEIKDVSDFLAVTLKLPDELIHGILHRGGKLAIGGGSKTYKTWNFVDLALSVAYGHQWLQFPTTQGRVLYVNFEIQEPFFQQRLQKVASAKGITLSKAHLDVWNLRGFASCYTTTIPKMAEAAKTRNYSLIIIDPIYKLYGETDENSANQVGKLLNAIESLAVQSNAAVAFGAHYSKGNQAAKEAIDRISGSGVFARDPDAILNFTKHQDADSFTVESTLRNHKPIEPFVVTWGFPLFICNDELDPADLKQQSPTKQKYYQPADLLSPILDRDSSNPVSLSEWARLASVKRTTLVSYAESLRLRDFIITIGEGVASRQAITPKGRAECGRASSD